MAHSLDVIIPALETTPKNFVARCLSSVNEAARRCSFRINVIQVPGVPGHIGQAMHSGLLQCSAQYVAWVDDDDFVLPNAFSCLEKHFDTNANAIFARELRLDTAGNLRVNNNRHHLAAFNRRVVDTVNLLEYPSYAFMALHEASQFKCWPAKVVDELSWVYVHRMWHRPGKDLRGKMSPQDAALFSDHPSFGQRFGGC